MKTISLTVLLLFVPLILYCGNDLDRKIQSETFSSEDNSIASCSEVTAKIIGKLYYFANPLEIFDNFARLEAFVNGNRNLFLPGSQVIQCMQMAGNRMINQGIQSYSQKDADNAYESALGMGATGEMANTIRTNVNLGATGMFALGRELQWLSQVIPNAAKGDWNNFINTGTDTRTQIIQYIRIIAPILDQFSLSILKQTMTQFEPYIEYQTAVFVYWSTK